MDPRHDGEWPGAGEFSCESDRKSVGNFVQAALDNKLRRLAAAGQSDLLRLLAAIFSLRVVALV